MSGGRTKPSALRRRVLQAFAVAMGMILVSILLGAATLLLTERKIRDTLIEQLRTDALLAEYSSSVMREILAGQRYLATGDSADAREFHELGFRTFELEQGSMVRLASGGESATTVALTRGQLAIAEGIFARAHRLMELGRREEALQALERAWPHVQEIDESIAGLMAHRADLRSAAIEEALADARRRGGIVLGIVLLAFLFVFTTSVGIVRSLSRAMEPVFRKVEELGDGRADLRLEPESLPSELEDLARALNRAGDSLGDLREAERLATIGILVSGVAHELNNPLTAILLRAEELAEGEEGERPSVLGREIRRDARRARKVVQELKTVAGDRSRDPERTGEEETREETSAPSERGALGRILLVDDEETIRRPTRRILERAGWEVDEAADGLEALEKIHAAEGGAGYQVILSDLTMPRMSGMELVDRLQEEPGDMARRVVIMTGDTVAPGPADFIRRTDLPVLEKPFEADELRRVLARAARGTEPGMPGDG